MLLQCRFGGWPLGPVMGVPLWGGLLVVAGVVFSVVMLIDCLKRKPADFVNPLTRNGEYDRLIWAGAIFVSLWFYCVGAIVYFFVIRRAKAVRTVDFGRQRSADSARARIEVCCFCSRRTQSPVGQDFFGAIGGESD